MKMWNLQTNQQQQVAKHDAPIRHCKLVSTAHHKPTGWTRNWQHSSLSFRQSSANIAEPNTNPVLQH